MPIAVQPFRGSDIQTVNQENLSDCHFLPSLHLKMLWVRQLKISTSCLQNLETGFIICSDHQALIFSYFLGNVSYLIPDYLDHRPNLASPAASLFPEMSFTELTYCHELRDRFNEVKQSTSLAFGLWEVTKVRLLRSKIFHPKCFSLACGLI